MRLAKIGKAELDKKVRDAAALLKLEPYLDRTPLNLSGGQQQRTAIARALVKGAELVLLDEPLANLDYKLREELRSEIPKIFQASGAIFVYATTEPHEALLLGGNTACLWEGRVTQFGPTAQVYRQPQDALTAEVFSDPPMNFFQARLGDGRLEHAGGVGPAGPLANLAEGSYRAGFRANHLSLVPVEGGIQFSGTSTGTEVTGSESYIHVDHDGERWVSRLHGIHTIEAGETVDLFVDPANLFLFDADGSLINQARAA